MRPDTETNNAFVYCLAVAAARFEVDVLFTVAMSNHHHTGIHDRHGNYPEFLEHFHKLFAKCQNSLRGRWENFWASEQTSVVHLDNPQDVLDRLVYSVNNPVKAHLVEYALEWPGVSSYRATLQGAEITAERPAHFFRADGPMPEKVALRFTRPRGFEGLSQFEWGKLLRTRVSEKEKAARMRRAKGGIRVAGIRAVLTQRWTSRPKTNEARRRLNPRVAAKSKWHRIEMLRTNRVFLEAYREAQRLFQAGFRTARFPAGTYWLKRFADVVCEDHLYLQAG